MASSPFSLPRSSNIIDAASSRHGIASIPVHSTISGSIPMLSSDVLDRNHVAIDLTTVHEIHRSLCVLFLFVLDVCETERQSYVPVRDELARAERTVLFEYLSNVVLVHVACKTDDMEFESSREVFATRTPTEVARIGRSGSRYMSRIPSCSATF